MGDESQGEAGTGDSWVLSWESGGESNRSPKNDEAERCSAL